MSRERLELGRLGEGLAADLLKKEGFRIIAKNYRTKLGEIDIIARDRDTICFIEVKTRNTADFGLPQDAVSAHKQRQIAKAALSFLKEKKLLDSKARFDVVSVVLENNHSKAELIKDAFELDASFTY